MCNPKIIYRLAGTLTVLSVALGLTVSVYWLALAAFVGLNLLQTSFTGFCPAERIFGRLGFFGCSSRRASA